MIIFYTFIKLFSKAVLSYFFSVSFLKPHSVLVFHFFSIKIGNRHTNWLQEMVTCGLSFPFLKAKVVYNPSHYLYYYYLTKPLVAKKKKEEKKSHFHFDF